MKWRSISSVTSKSAITPSFSGLIAWIVPGVRPSIRLASIPTACTSPVRESIATTLGSDSTIPRAPAPLAAREVPLDQLIRERAEADLRARDPRALVRARQQRDAAQHLVRRAAQRAQRRPRGLLVGRLAVDHAAQRHHRVAPEHRPAHPLLAGRARLAQRILEHRLARVARLELLDVLRTDAELHAEPLEQRPAL